MRRVFCLLFMLFLAGCQQQTAPKPTKAAFPTDDWNRAVALEKPAQRVVCIGPGAIETIFALGAGTQLVGRDQYADFPPVAKKLPIAGDFNGPFLEKTAALRPDLVIVQGETYDAARCDKWQKQLGVPVAALSAKDLAGVAQDFRKIGSWIGKSGAEKLAAPLENQKPPVKLGTAIFEVGRSPLWVAGQDTLIDEILKAAGLENAAKIGGYQAFNLESLAAHPPDFYVVTGKSSEKKAILADLQKRPGLKDLLAVKQGRVIVLNGDWVLRAGPRLAQGIEQLRREVAM